MKHIRLFENFDKKSDEEYRAYKKYISSPGHPDDYFWWQRNATENWERGGKTSDGIRVSFFFREDGDAEMKKHDKEYQSERKRKGIFDKDKFPENEHTGKINLEMIKSLKQLGISNPDSVELKDSKNILDGKGTLAEYIKNSFAQQHYWFANEIEEEIYDVPKVLKSTADKIYVYWISEIGNALSKKLNRMWRNDNLEGDSITVFDDGQGEGSLMFTTLNPIQFKKIFSKTKEN